MTNLSALNGITCCPFIEKLLALMEANAKESREKATKYMQLNRDFSRNLAELLKHNSTSTRTTWGDKNYGMVKDFLLEHLEELQEAHAAGLSYRKLASIANKTAHALKLKNFSVSSTYVHRILTELSEKRNKCNNIS